MARRVLGCATANHVGIANSFFAVLMTPRTYCFNYLLLWPKSSGLGHFVPRQTTTRSFAFWADTVLQLALRKIDGSPLSQSATCYTWDEESINSRSRSNCVHLWNEFLTGEMSDAEIRISCVGLPKPFWFWFAELKNFVAKSNSAVDWIVGRIQQEETGCGRSDFRGEMQKFSDILAGCENSMTKLLLVAQLVGRSTGKSFK